jgi:hypothetical protein
LDAWLTVGVDPEVAGTARAVAASGATRIAAVTIAYY